jgi:hypothetical protein
MGDAGCSQKHMFGIVSHQRMTLRCLVLLRQLHLCHVLTRGGHAACLLCLGSSVEAGVCDTIWYHASAAAAKAAALAGACLWSVCRRILLCATHKQAMAVPSALLGGRLLLL